jgi:hypothetical protein
MATERGFYEKAFGWQVATVPDMGDTSVMSGPKTSRTRDAVKDAGGNTVSERQPIGDMTPPPTSPTPNAT